MQSAKAYTDAALGNQQTLSDLRTQMNDQFQQVNKRIDDQGAMGAASTQMAINAAGATGAGRLAAGVGYQGARSALSVGYAAPIGNAAHISVGATTSGSQTSVVRASASTCKKHAAAKPLRAAFPQTPGVRAGGLLFAATAGCLLHAVAGKHDGHPATSAHTHRLIETATGSHGLSPA